MSDETVGAPARPKDPPAPYVRKIGPLPGDVDDWASVHMPDELDEYAETLCGLSLDGVDLEGWSSIPMHEKTCESCLRIRTDRDAKAAYAETKAKGKAKP